MSNTENKVEELEQQMELLAVEMDKRIKEENRQAELHKSFRRDLLAIHEKIDDLRRQVETLQD
jgi:hypothetical protein